MLQMHFGSECATDLSQLPMMPASAPQLLRSASTRACSDHLPVGMTWRACGFTLGALPQVCSSSLMSASWKYRGLESSEAVTPTVLKDV